MVNFLLICFSITLETLLVIGENIFLVGIKDAITWYFTSQYNPEVSTWDNSYL